MGELRQLMSVVAQVLCNILWGLTGRCPRKMPPSRVAEDKGLFTRVQHYRV